MRQLLIITLALMLPGCAPKPLCPPTTAPSTATAPAPEKPPCKSQDQALPAEPPTRVRFVIEEDLGPLTAEDRNQAQQRVQLLEHRATLATSAEQQARKRFLNLVAPPGLDRVSQTGRDVTVAVIDGGIAPTTARHLGPRLVSYHEMDDQYRIQPKTAPVVRANRSVTPGNPIIEKIVPHGDNMVRLVDHVAPGARFVIVNNYHRKHQVTQHGLTYDIWSYAGPRSIADAITYLLRAPGLPPVRVISLSEGFPPFQKRDSQSIRELQAAFKQAFDRGIIIVMSSGNIRRGNPRDSHKSGLNLGVGCPWVLPVGQLDEKLKALPSARYDYAQRHPVLYVPASSSSSATAKAAGLVALLLERNPQLTPAEVKKLLFDTADVHEEDERRVVHVANIEQAIARLDATTAK